MFRRTSVFALLIVVGCSDSISPAARSTSPSKQVTPAAISIRILPNLDGNDVTVTAFNQYDVVTGFRTSPTPRFFRSRTSIEYLAPPAAGFTIGATTPGLTVGINSDGKVVGSIISDTASRAFIWWHNGGTTLLEPTYPHFPGSVAVGCGASGINDSGYVVGACISGANYFGSKWGPNLTNTFNGCCAALRSISANGYITGASLLNGPPQALVWAPGAASFTTIGVANGGPQQSEGLAVNDSGWVAGWGNTPDSAAQLWVPGQPVRVLSHLGAATGIDNANNVVGYHRDASNSPPVAFLWNFANGATFLPGLPNGGATAAVAINSNHEILGWAIDQNGLKHAVIWTF